MPPPQKLPQHEQVSCSHGLLGLQSLGLEHCSYPRCSRFSVQVADLREGKDLHHRQPMHERWALREKYHICPDARPKLSFPYLPSRSVGNQGSMYARSPRVVLRGFPTSTPAACCCSAAPSPRPHHLTCCSRQLAEAPAASAALLILPCSHLLALLAQVLCTLPGYHRRSSALLRTLATGPSERSPPAPASQGSPAYFPHGNKLPKLAETKCEPQSGL